MAKRALLAAIIFDCGLGPSLAANLPPISLAKQGVFLLESGGEWISSIAIENITLSHRDVAPAAAIAVPHEKWGERPLLMVVPKAGSTLEPQALQDFYRGKMPDWSIPDRVVIAQSIPYGATGKILKTELRRIYVDSGR